jgi:hypothetical protein
LWQFKTLGEEKQMALDLRRQVEREISRLNKILNLLDEDEGVPTRKIRSNTNSSKSAKARWEGWKEYKSAHPSAKPAEFFKSKKKKA